MPVLLEGSHTAAVFPSAKSGSEDDNEYGTLLEKHWQQKTEVLEDKTTPLTLSAPQIPSLSAEVSKFDY